MGTSNECQPSRNSGGSRSNRGRLLVWVECGHKNTLDEIWQKEVSARTPSMGHQVLFSIKLDSIFGFFISVLEGVFLESHLSARVRCPISRLLSDFLPFRSVSLLLAAFLKHHVLLDPFPYSGAWAQLAVPTNDATTRSISSIATIKFFSSSLKSASLSS